MKENRIKQSESRVIMRSQIRLAPYNPRKISDEARRRLKANLKRIGVLGGIVWNERTGNLVSGHQKVGIMDEVNRYDPETHENDYPIKVEVTDLDEKTEMEQNLFMNNREVQGEYDDDKLREMLKSDIDFSLAGFDDFDLQMLGIGDVDESFIANEKWSEELLTQDDDNLASLAANTKGGAESRGIDRTKSFYEDTPENQIARHNEIKKIKERIKSQNGIDEDDGMLSYVVLSFKNPTERLDYMEMYGYNLLDTYIDGADFFSRVEFGIPK